MQLAWLAPTPRYLLRMQLAPRRARRTSRLAVALQ